VYALTEPEDFKLQAARFAPQEVFNGSSGLEATENEDAGWECYSKADQRE